MDENLERDSRAAWIFAVAAGLLVIGAVAPVALTAGGTNRLNVVAIPYVIAAIALAANAFVYKQGRMVAAILYFVGGLAIVYGILGMLAVPLRLAVIGTCPEPLARCPAGLEQPLTGGENNALDAATICGILAIFIAFYGLALVYRRRKPAAPRPAAIWPSTRPATPSTPGQAATAPPDPPTEEELQELPAPEELKELPPPA